MITENTFDKSKLISELKESHIELVKVYKKIFDNRYKTNEDFKMFIDKEYKENKISTGEQQVWNDNFCHRASYTLLNKILFIRICEDKGFMLNADDYVAGEPKDLHIGKKLSRIGLQKWANLVTNYTLGELVKLAFLDMKKSYGNIALYKDDKYEILTPTTEELSLKYLDGDDDAQKLVLQFENALSNIVEKLDTNNYNFNNTDGNILGDVYEKFMDRETRKAIGQFYTPEFVIEYILNNTVAEADVVENPFVSVADISCGSGHFLIMAYDMLREKFINSLELLRDNYADEVYYIKRDGREVELTGKDYWKEENIHYHILKHCNYGADIDSFAIQLTTINLLLKDLDNFTDELNILECDSLIKWERKYDWRDLEKQLEDEYEIINTKQVNLFGEEELTEIKQKKDRFTKTYNNLGVEVKESINRERAENLLKLCYFWNKEFDYVLGNPPYMGQKGNSESFEKFKKDPYWSGFYERMQDLYYYFYARGIEKVKAEGKLGFITPPYWLTAKASQNLKKVLISKMQLIRVFDFSNKKVFDDAQIDGNIFIFKKSSGNDVDERITINLYDNKNNDLISFTSKISNSELDTGMWNIFIRNEEKDYFNNNIRRMGEFCTISPGIQSGCDKVSASHIKKYDIPNSKIGDGIFILSSDEIKKLNFNKSEKKLLKKFYKNSQIERYFTSKDTDQYLISVNEIDNISDYPNIEQHLRKYKSILDSRHRNFALRKADKEGKWFALQTYRPTTNFEGEKIIPPYRSKVSRFSYSSGPFYGSVDIFYISVNDSNFDIFYILGIINSNLMLYWLLKNCKKKGEILELYTEPLNNIPIKMVNHDKQIELSNIVKKIIELKKKYYEMSELELLINSENLIEDYSKMESDLYEINSKINECEKNLNKYIYNLYNVEDEDIVEIENYLSDMIPEVNLENDEPLVIDFDKLFYYLYDLIRLDINKILLKNHNYCDLSFLNNKLRENNEKFDKIISVLKKDDITKRTIDIIRQTINAETNSWNSYIKAKNKNKISKKFIKYYDGDNYGLAEWSDEIHKNYFLDAIEEYTVNNPNEKKAKDILKLFKGLDIEDKQDYIEVIEEKIRKTFK